MAEEENYATEPAPVLNPEQTRLAKKALLEAFGLQISTIANPESAPAVVDFSRFWRKIGLQYVGLHFRREKYIGADFNPRTGKLEVTETKEGKEKIVFNTGEHFVNFHNEPPYPGIEKSTPLVQLIDQLPDPHYEDVSNFITDNNIHCEVIMRMISKKQAGVVALIKTAEHKNLQFQMLVSKHSAILRKGLHETLNNDHILIAKNRVTIYRGFVDFPPKENAGFLRIRKA